MQYDTSIIVWYIFHMSRYIQFATGMYENYALFNCQIRLIDNLLDLGFHLLTADVDCII